MKALHLTAEMLETAKAAKTAEDLKKLAQEYGITLTGEQAQEAFERLNTAGELADDELESVAGGPMAPLPPRGKRIQKQC